MTDILTESFCERCGTRYTFESTRPKRLSGVKVLSRGLKNFVMSDGTSLDEAMAAARSETDRAASAPQLDAFHKTFNFCMSCRQYTCPNCWNEAEVACLTCAPQLGQEIMPASFPDLAPTGHVGAAASGQNGTNGITAQHDVNGSAHPTSEPTGDDEFDAVARLDSISATPTDEHVAASTPTSIADKTTSQTGGLLRRFRPGTNLDAELEAYERERVEVDSVELIGVAAASEPEPEVAAAEPEPEVVAAGPEPEPEPEFVAAVEAAEPEPEVVAAAPEPEPEPEVAAAEPEPGIRPGLPTDVIPQPTWRMTAPDPSREVAAADQRKSAEDVAAAAAKAGPPAEPQWPPRPEWLRNEPSVGLPFLGRSNAPQGGLEAIWAESDRAVAAASAARGKPAAAGGVQPCVSCGLSLSATARFCRRCGTHQSG